MLNLTHVRSFVAVIDSGNFADASRNLICSQPTISQHVLKLEAMLQAPLIVRDRHGCYPTPEGLVFMPFARSLLKLAERAHGALRNRTLTIGASSNIGIYILQPYLKSFRLKHASESRVDVWIASNPDVAAKLTNHEIDIAVMEWWNGRAGFAATLWRRETLVVIVAPEHPWSAQASVNKAQLFDVPLIGGESGSGTGRVLREAFGENVKRLRIEMQLGSTEAVKHAVAAGLGASIVLASAVADEVNAGTLCARSIEGAELKKDLYIVCREDQPQGALPSCFAAHLQDGLHSQSCLSI